jgi:hypothetical protein
MSTLEQKQLYIQGDDGSWVTPLPWQNEMFINALHKIEQTHIQIEMGSFITGQNLDTRTDIETNKKNASGQISSYRYIMYFISPDLHKQVMDHKLENHTLKMYLVNLDTGKLREMIYQKIPVVPIILSKDKLDMINSIPCLDNMSRDMIYKFYDSYNPVQKPWSNL